MKSIAKTFPALAIFLSATCLPASAQVLLAGWDTWSTGAAPSPTRLATDITAVAATVIEAGPNNQVWRVNDGRGASADGDWGTVMTDPAASTVVGESGDLNLCIELGNATTGGTLTFTITNNGLANVELGSFNFDSYAFRRKAARTYELSVLEGGGITPGVIYTSAADEIPQVNGNFDNLAHLDIDHDLTGLADHTLGSGESASFALAFSGGFGDNAGGHDLWVDNVAIFDASGSEPEGIGEVRIAKDPENVENIILTFNSSGPVDIYRSTDLRNWGQPWAAGEESPYTDEEALADALDGFFYILVPTGTPFPSNP